MQQPPPAGGQRPFIGVHLKCCHVYVHVPMNRAGDAFVGWCPRCAAQIRVPIVAEGGSTSRIIEAS